MPSLSDPPPSVRCSHTMKTLQNVCNRNCYRRGESGSSDFFTIDQVRVARPRMLLRPHRSHAHPLACTPASARRQVAAWLAAGGRCRPVYGLWLVRCVVRAPCARSRDGGVAQALRAAGRHALHRLQRMRRALPVPCDHDGPRAARGPQAGRLKADAGSRTTARKPPSRDDASRRTVAPWSCATERTMARPRPLPGACGSPDR